MTRGEAWFTHASTLLVGGGGLVYGWMRYFAEPVDEFSVVNHPWQPEFHHLHILVAPLMVFAIGLLWQSHILGRVRSGFAKRRRTGLALFALVLPMIASGYLVQVSTSEFWQPVWVWTHGITGCLWIVAYLFHHLFARKGPANAPGS